jgi:hypothetical protein
MSVWQRLRLFKLFYRPKDNDDHMIHGLRLAEFWLRFSIDPPRPLSAFANAETRCAWCKSLPLLYAAKTVVESRLKILALRIRYS